MGEFPENREFNREFSEIRPRRGAGRGGLTKQSGPWTPNSLPDRTGNFPPPSREFSASSRELFVRPAAWTLGVRPVGATLVVAHDRAAVDEAAGGHKGRPYVAVVLIGRRYLIGTITLITSWSSGVVTGSVAYSSMNRSFASSRFSSRWLVIAS
jgi:hypothetical protein